MGGGRIKPQKNCVPRSSTEEELGPGDVSFDDHVGIYVMCLQCSLGTCRWWDMVVKTLEPESQGLGSGAMALYSCPSFLSDILCL